MATGHFVNAQLASCLANGLGALCGSTASSGCSTVSPAIGTSMGNTISNTIGSAMGPVSFHSPPMGSALGSDGISCYSGSSSGSSSSGSREHSISSTTDVLADMLHALSSDLDLDQQCHNCGECGVMLARCNACSEVLCDMCASAHQRVPLANGTQLPASPQCPPCPPPHGLPLTRLTPPLLPPPGSSPPLAPGTCVTGVTPSAGAAGVSPPSRSPRTRPRASPVTCDQHVGEPLKLYCDTCATTLCGACKGHRGHVVTYVKVATEASKSSNIKHLGDATSGAQEMRDQLEHSHKMAEAVDKKAMQVASEVRQASRRLIAAVEARERDLLSQVDKVRALKGKSLMLQVEVLRGLLQRFVRLQDSLRDTLQHGEGVDHLHTKDKAAVELAQLRAARANLGNSPLPYEDDALVFVPPEPVLLRALSSMGSVSSSGYALTTMAVGDGLTRAVRGRPAAFTVHVKNHLGEPSVSSAPEAVEAVLVAADGTVTCADVEDRRDGSFLAVYRARAEGVHALHVTLRGRHIVGSPFTLVVRALRAYDTVRAPALTFGGEGSEDGRFLRPWGICCDRQGRLIVADRSNNRLQVFRPDGTFLFKFGSQGSAPGQFDRPAGVASDAQGRIIVADKDNHRIQIFAADGQFLLTFGEMGSKNGQFNYPWDVDVNAAGQIVVSDTRNHRIQLFSPDGQYLNKYGWEGSASMWKHFDTPRGVCFNADGYVIVTDFNNHRLVVVEPSFRNARFLGSEGSGLKQFLRPQGVAVDADGHIIVADSRNNRVQIYTSNGTFRCQIGLPIEMDRPSGVCLTPEGMIALIDFGNHRVVML